MNPILKSFLIILGVTVVFVPVGVWAMLFNHPIFGTIWLLIYTMGLYFFLNNQFGRIVTFLVLVPTVSFSLGGGLIFYVIFKEKFESEAGVLYTLAEVRNMQTNNKYDSKNHTDYLAFTAEFVTPTYGLISDEYVIYDYYNRDENLDAKFPVKGRYALMKYPVAMPKSFGCENINPSADDLIKYASPVVVTPEKDTLWGTDAMDYIREYIKSKE